MIIGYDENRNIVDLEKIGKQIRKEAIEECLKIVKFHENNWDGICWAIDELEQLKEREV